MNKCFLIFLAGIILFIAPTMAQSAKRIPTVKGTLDITYNTHSDIDESGQSKEGVTDLYLYNLTVVDTLLFNGEICHQPTLFSSILGRETQAALIQYDMTMSVRNPENVAEVKVVGKIAGKAPIDKKGVYCFSDGTLRMAIEASGKAAAFESQFSGSADGKIPTNDSTLAHSKKAAITLSKNVRGIKANIIVTDYEIMKFRNLILPSGPAQNYPEITVNGELMYDYERTAWFFRDVELVYILDGKEVTDKLTGHIKWNADPKRDVNGKGYYKYDVRVNEADEPFNLLSIFEETDNESTFFATDYTLHNLVGTAKYDDLIRNEILYSSKILIDLTGNNLSKVQVVNLTKLLLLIGVVPMNDCQ